MRRPLVLSLTVALLSGLCAVGTAQAAPVASVAPATAEPPSVPGELLVGYVKGAKASDRDRARGRAGAERKERVVGAAADRSEVELVRLPAGKSRAQAEKELESDPAVAYAEPNWIYQHAGKPGGGASTTETANAVVNDKHFADGSLWGMYGDTGTPTNQHGSQAAEAWMRGTTGVAPERATSETPTVIIGVIDEGIQTNHPDLDANIWVNPYDAKDGTDNDGNGYIDDINGWDFDGGNNTVYDGGTRGSLDDHGTHVAGTIGAEVNNTIGVAGANWHVKMISGKFLGRRGGTTANAVKAVDYFTDLKTRHGMPIAATNNSWGGGGSSEALRVAIARADAANILFIAAAGNGGGDGVGDDNDTTENYPANYDVPNVIAVAAIDKGGALAAFSNYGATTVDLGAPGVGVWSTTAYNTYSSYSGTSMATPHVTGGAALYASTHPGASAATIKAAILDAARSTPTASLSGKTVTGGRLNVSGF